MTKIKYWLGCMLIAVTAAACDEDTYGIGNSLTGDNDKLDITPEIFEAHTSTILADSVLAKSSDCYFGKVKDPLTRSYITSEFSSQFHVLETFYMSPEDSILSRYKDRAGADSCELVIFFDTPFKSKDSLVSMKMRISELERPIEEGSLLYSNLDPKALVRTDDGSLSASKMFSYNDLAETDSAKSTSTYLHNIRIKLNAPYKDKAGNEYNNYGTYLMQKYYDSESRFKNQYYFSHDICPGIFFEIVDGFGFHAKITNIGLRVYYKVQNDTTYEALATLAGTEEVLKTTKITNDRTALAELKKEQSCTYIKSPAGLFTEVELPVAEIMQSHQQDSLIGAKIIFQRLNNEVYSEQALGIPSTLLLLPKDSITNFFEANKLPDSETAYYTTFASATNTYAFSNISKLVTKLWRNKTQGEANSKDTDWTATHPDWNKVVLVPITISSSSSTSTITSVSNDLSLTSTRLVGGATPVAVNVVFAKFKE